MLISELAQRCRTTVHALRHYEKCGLLQPTRRANGWRDYPATLQREVVFITMSRAIGFSLREIGEWLPAYRSRKLTFAQLDEIMVQRLADIDARIAALKRQRQAVADHRVWIRQQQQRPARDPAAAPAPASAKPWPRTPARHLKGKP